MMPTWIAEEKVIFVFPSGRRILGRLALGLPTQVDSTEARCVATLEGLDSRPYPIIGASTMQALLLAARFMRMRLQDHLSKGGRVLDPDAKSDLALDAIFGSIPGLVAPERPRRSGVRGTRRRSPQRKRRESPT
jgi:hypothetical protein